MRYIAELHEKGRPDSSYATYEYDAENGKQAAIGHFMDCAETTMRENGIRLATLVMKEYGGSGIGSRDLEN
jgi:hypothetical protein